MGEKEGRTEKVMEGVASVALLPNGSVSGHFIQLPNSICYGLYGTELECERECSHGEDYRLIKLTVTDYNSKKDRDIVVECRGHDAAKICTTDHAHGWQKDVVGMVEQKHEKSKVSVSFECETLKADTAAEDHLTKFMPKLVGMDAVGSLKYLVSPHNVRDVVKDHQTFYILAKNGMNGVFTIQNAARFASGRNKKPVLQ